MRKLFLVGAALAVLSAVPAAAQAPDSIKHVGMSGTLSNVVVAPAASKMVYLSGVLGNRGGETIELQAKAIMDNIKASVEAQGGTMDHIVKCLIFMSDITERNAFNMVWSTYFPNVRPARSAIGGIDLGGPKVEVECIAAIP
jgi:2-iminobutanoate/2-iminopropanoate deaminase